jgi:probable F420-dependent oxidoreductase
MQFGVVIPNHGPFGDRTAIRDLIQAAEDLGFHTAWFGDHVVIPDYATGLSHPNWFDALACCIFGAGATSRLRFGTDVLVLPYRNPVVLSQLLATADQLSDGRLTLGVGVGYISGEFAALDTPPYEARGRATDEYLDVLHALWTSDGATTHHGEFVRFDDIHAAPAPRQQPFPVWVGGNGPVALRRAARRGTGWHPLFPTPEQYAAGRAQILAIRDAEGRTDPFTFSYSCPGVSVLDAGAPRAKPMSYDDFPDIPDEYRYAPPFPVTADGRVRFVGSPEEIATDLCHYRDAGVDHVALRFWTADPAAGVADVLAQFERFTNAVVPAFDAAG